MSAHSDKRYPTIPASKSCSHFQHACLQAHRYLSADSVGESHNAHLYPMEFLNSLTPSGCPPHCLDLKEGSPVMLLRNLNNNRGLANGTRLVCREFRSRVIKAEVVTGTRKGDTILLPRIVFDSDDLDTPFELRRRQFPIRPAFTMTINKSQGQTMEKVGLFLPQPVFSHGQFYVAASRVGSAAQISICVQHGRFDGRDGVFTKNVVYKQILGQAV